MAEVKLIRSARELAVYKRAYALSLEVHRESLLWPKTEQYALADQMRRASKSICANLAEGFAKQSHSKAEFSRFISMTIGSCSEMETWVMYAFDLGYISQETLNAWMNEYAAILSMLIKLRNTLQ
jgi:four helix bundle protein